MSCSSWTELTAACLPPQLLKRLDDVGLRGATILFVQVALIHGYHEHARLLCPHADYYLGNVVLGRSDVRVGEDLADAARGFVQLLLPTVSARAVLYDEVVRRWLLRRIVRHRRDRPAAHGREAFDDHSAHFRARTAINAGEGEGAARSAVGRWQNKSISPWCCNLLTPHPLSRHHCAAACCCWTRKPRLFSRCQRWRRSQLISVLIQADLTWEQNGKYYNRYDFIWPDKGGHSKIRRPSW